MLQAIIFDADGVIFDNEDLWDEGQKIFLGRWGKIYDRALTKHRLTGRSLSDGVRIMQEQYNFPGDPEALAEERMQIMKKLYGQVQLIPGFLEFLSSIQPEYKTAVATSSNLELFKILDKKFSITKLFNGHVYFLKDVNFISKPAPDIFLYAAKMLACDPKDCLVIEDAPLGIEAAKRAGMKAVGLMSSYPKDVLSAADQVVSKFSEITFDGDHQLKF